MRRVDVDAVVGVVGAVCLQGGGVAARIVVALDLEPDQGHVRGVDLGRADDRRRPGSGPEGQRLGAAGENLPAIGACGDVHRVTCGADAVGSREARTCLRIRVGSGTGLTCTRATVGVHPDVRGTGGGGGEQALVAAVVEGRRSGCRRRRRRRLRACSRAAGEPGEGGAGAGAARDAGCRCGSGCSR